MADKSTKLGRIVDHEDLTIGAHQIQLDASSNAYVNVPWTDTVYTHPSVNHIPTGQTGLYWYINRMANNIIK